MRFLLFCVLLVFVSGCGQSGTWKDDAANWKRAFEQEQPKEIKVIHSWHCRTQHFTHESQYFFEIAPDEKLHKSFSDPGRVVEVTSDNKDDQDALQLALYEKPSWFAPKTSESYTIYQGKRPLENYFFFLDRDSGAIFITDRIGM